MAFRHFPDCCSDGRRRYAICCDLAMPLAGNRIPALTARLVMPIDPFDSKSSVPEALGTTDTPAGVDRRAFMMRSAMIGAVTVISGCAPSTPGETAVKASTATPPAKPAGASSLSKDLEVVKKSKGPVMTVIDE